MANTKHTLLGGHDGTNKTSKIELLNTLEARWENRSDFGVGREHMGLVLLQGLIVGMGGTSHYGGSHRDGTTLEIPNVTSFLQWIS